MVIGNHQGELIHASVKRFRTARDSNISEVVAHSKVNDSSPFYLFALCSKFWSSHVCRGGNKMDRHVAKWDVALNNDNICMASLPKVF